MEKLLLQADKRLEIGKGGARSLRRSGMLPAIVCVGGKSTSIKVNHKEMTKMMFTGAGEHALITIELNENGTKASEHPVLVKDYQLDPITDQLLHVDFIEVSLKDKVKVAVFLNITKEPAGIKQGGISEQHLREIEIECLPTSIPESLDVDASHVNVGQSLHVSDLTAPEGVEILTDPGAVILNVSVPRVEAEPEEGVEEEAAEPELVKAKGKGEEEEEEKKES